MPHLPSLPCTCARLRRASRALTQFYDDALRPAGLRATQFTVLQALSLTGEVTQGELGRLLAMDSTTLTRTLEIMARKGWIAKRLGKDRRERTLHLVNAGEALFQRVLPRWERVQAELRKRLGDPRWNELMTLTQEVTEAVTN